MPRRPSILTCLERNLLEAWTLEIHLGVSAGALRRSAVRVACAKPVLEEDDLEGEAVEVDAEAV